KGSSDGRTAGAGGDGLGGAIFVGGGTVTLVASTVTNNTAQGGAGGGGNLRHRSLGVGEGGGVDFCGSAVGALDGFTLAHLRRNTASTSDPDIFGAFARI